MIKSNNGPGSLTKNRKNKSRFGKRIENKTQTESWLNSILNVFNDGLFTYESEGPQDPIISIHDNKDNMD